jgi:hypothetical protein
MSCDTRLKCGHPCPYKVYISAFRVTFSLIVVISSVILTIRITWQFPVSRLAVDFVPEDTPAIDSAWTLAVTVDSQYPM